MNSSPPQRSPKGDGVSSGSKARSTMAMVFSVMPCHRVLPADRSLCAGIDLPSRPGMSRQKGRMAAGFGGHFHDARRRASLR